MIHGANMGHEYVFHELFLLFKTSKTLFFRLFYPLIPIYLVPFSASQKPRCYLGFFIILTIIQTIGIHPLYSNYT